MSHNPAAANPVIIAPFHPDGQRRGVAGPER